MASVTSWPFSSTRPSVKTMSSFSAMRAMVCSWATSSASPARVAASPAMRYSAPESR
jgi:hypothetical protein